VGRRRVVIGLAIGIVVLVGAAGAWAYDHSRRDTVAEGVRVAGVDVGGMDAAQARAALRERLLDDLREPVVATYHGHRVVLSPARAGVAVDVEGAVDAALARGREGGIFARLGRELTGGSVDADVRPRVTYSRIAVDHFMAEVVDRFDRAARDASVAFAPTSIDPVPAQKGVTVERRRLRRAVVHALTTAAAPHTVAVRARVVRPEVTTDELAKEYPVIITVDRASFRLRLWKDLKLAKTYRIAVGQIGLETPAGLYHVQNKQVDPVWNVPHSDWAGRLAGRVIQPGPSNPLKARWMGIYNGAGIHGTDAIDSLGSAASHGCIRMAVPDVIDLYNQTPVGTPVYIA
jgi:lipoprotein-anchoring transpeptidase ErfK/SrfK